MTHERNTADERYESVEAFLDPDGPTFRQPYGIAYNGQLTGSLVIQKGGLRKLTEKEAVIVNKRNARFTVMEDKTVLKNEEPVGLFNYAFRLGE